MYLAYNGPEELVDIFNLPSCDAGTIVQMLITSQGCEELQDIYGKATMSIQG